MAQFVADGYLRFDEIVPDELNKAAYAQMETGDIEEAKNNLEKVTE
ncbi:uncharacterized protein METZ01_LOCUS417765, partial [marine metagenome]